MKAVPEIITSSRAPDECRQVLNSLLLRWPEEPSDTLSTVLLDHLCHCRSCLQKWIALEAAADLASFSETSGSGGPSSMPTTEDSQAARPAAI